MCTIICWYDSWSVVSSNIGHDPCALYVCCIGNHIANLQVAHIHWLVSWTAGADIDAVRFRTEVINMAFTIMPQAKSQGLHVKKLSGTKFRKMLRAGDDIPEWFAFKSVVSVLREHAQAK